MHQKVANFVNVSIDCKRTTVQFIIWVCQTRVTTFSLLISRAITG